MQSSEFGGIYQSREFAEDLRTAALPFSIVTQGYVNTLKVFIDFFWKYQKTTNIFVLTIASPFPHKHFWHKIYISWYFAVH